MGTMAADAVHWNASVHVDKWSPEQVREAIARYGTPEPTHEQLLALFGAPADVADWKGNLVTIAGLGMVTNLILGLGAQAANGNTTTRIGMGNGTGTAARSDTDLSAASGSANRWFQPCTVSQITTAYTNDTMNFVALFGTSNGNFVWNEWCADAETEIMTIDGWRRYDELSGAPEVLVLDPVTFTTRFEPLLDVAIWPERKRTLRLFEGASHSSLTTLDHRWLTVRPDGNTAWQTTATLNWKSRIPKCAPYDGAPAVAKYDDAFIELIGWYWTEGWLMRRGGSVRAAIGQSQAKNPANVAAIRRALAACFPGGWSETRRPDGMVHFELQVEPTRAITAVTGADKEPAASFLVALTQAQLHLLIGAAISGDGTIQATGQRSWRQVAPSGVRSFEMACALAGIATTTTQPADDPTRFGRTPLRVGLLKRQVVLPVHAALPSTGSQTAVDALVEHEGIVWCPRTPSATWLARRRGTVYFTGNCIDVSAPTVSAGSTVGTTLLNHATSASLGTKGSGAAFTATVAIQLS
jgi:hypothetical protein